MSSISSSDRARQDDKVHQTREEYENEPVIQIGQSFQPLLNLSSRNKTLTAEQINNAKCSI